MNEKILPMQYPLITSWTWQANLLSILFSHPKTLDWIFSNYILLVCIEDQRLQNDRLAMDFVPSKFWDCPWIYMQIHDREFINRHYPNIEKYFIDSILDNYYVYGIIDENCLLNLGSKYVHELFLFGFNKEINVFNVADFTFKNKYSFETADINQVCKGYYNVTKEEDYMLSGNGGIILLKYLDDAFYPFDRMLVKQNLQCYIHPELIYNFYRILAAPHRAAICGIDIYDAIIQNIKGSHYDVRLLHDLYDHKVMMVERVRYMIENKHVDMQVCLLNEFDELKTIASIIRNVMLKLTVKKSNDKESQNMVIKELSRIKEKERYLYEQLSNSIYPA